MIMIIISNKKGDTLLERYSKNREAILNCLRATKEHPTAEWVYEKLKPEFPNLSLATVYRNVKTLEADGLVVSLGAVDGKERYDACVESHAHAVCEKCGRIIDLNINFPKDTRKKIESKTGFSVTEERFVFGGICADCKKK